MKSLISLILFLTLYGCGGSTTQITTDTAVTDVDINNIPISQPIVIDSNDIIGNTTKIRNLEVAEFDFPKEINCNEAKIACESLGRGWRLPTKDELDILYQNKDKIGGFADNYYWSSTEGGNGTAWNQSFDNGLQFPTNLFNAFYVRAIRTLPLEKESNDIIGNTTKIRNLEVAELNFPKNMNWEDAKRECENLGRGWRLPTKDELDILYQNNDKIGGFTYNVYWSSTEYSTSYAWSQNVDNGGKEYSDKNFAHYVRAVRTF